jgi:hypothetical protein
MQSEFLNKKTTKTERIKPRHEETEVFNSIDDVPALPLHHAGANCD